LACGCCHHRWPCCHRWRVVPAGWSRVWLPSARGAGSIMQLQELAATTLPQGCNTNSKAANRQAQRVLEGGPHALELHSLSRAFSSSCAFILKLWIQAATGTSSWPAAAGAVALRKNQQQIQELLGLHQWSFVACCGGCCCVCVGFCVSLCMGAVGVRRGGFIKSGATRCFQLSSPHATCKLFAK